MTPAPMKTTSKTLVTGKTSGDDDESLEEVEFMAQVNKYLDTRQSSSNALEMEAALEGILRRNSTKSLNDSSNKAVSFATDQTAAHDAWKDANERSKSELLGKIQNLQEQLLEAQSLAALEKEKRKKKEKTLIKLAKELKKRNVQREQGLERMEELEEKKRYLEHHWVLAGKELDQEKLLRQSLQAEQQHELSRALKEEELKYERAIKTYEDRIATLQSTHAKHCDELSQEILKANLEADRLHNQLTSGSSPRSTKLFQKKSSSFSEVSIPSIVLVSMAIMMFAVWGLSVELFSKGALCAPIRPGQTLGMLEIGSSFEAPWWVPSAYKERVYEQVCAATPPTRLQWVADGREAMAIVSQGNKKILKQAGLVRLDSSGGNLTSTNRKGLAQDYPNIWTL